MKTAFVNCLAFTGAVFPKWKDAEVEARPRSVKMDKFLNKINGSSRYNVANVAAQVSQALEKSKKLV